jgi:hypothetical protein
MLRFISNGDYRGFWNGNKILYDGCFVSSLN